MRVPKWQGTAPHDNSPHGERFPIELRSPRALACQVSALLPHPNQAPPGRQPGGALHCPGIATLPDRVFVTSNDPDLPKLQPCKGGTADGGGYLRRETPRREGLTGPDRLGCCSGLFWTCDQRDAGFPSLKAAQEIPNPIHQIFSGESVAGTRGVTGRRINQSTELRKPRGVCHMERHRAGSIGNW